MADRLVPLQYSKAKWSGSLPVLSGMLGPFGALHKRFAWATGRDKEYTILLIIEATH